MQIGVYGLNQREFREFYRTNKHYEYINPRADNIDGKQFDIIISYKPIDEIDQFVKFNLRARLSNWPLCIHYVNHIDIFKVKED